MEARILLYYMKIDVSILLTLSFRKLLLIISVYHPCNYIGMCDKSGPHFKAFMNWKRALKFDNEKLCATSQLSVSVRAQCNYAWRCFPRPTYAWAVVKGLITNQYCMFEQFLRE